eukprot:2842422-Amphidinium_carterae.1
MRDGIAVASHAGRVPSVYFEQMVAQGETLALARILEETRCDLTIYSDCLGVVNIWNRGPAYLLTGKVRYQSLWRRIWDAAEGRVISVLKVAAHQQEPPKDDPRWIHWAGNDFVDRLSKAVLRGDEINPLFRRAYLESRTQKALITLHAQIMTDMAKDDLWDYPWWDTHKHVEQERTGRRHWEPPTWLLTWANKVDMIDHGFIQDAPTVLRHNPSGRARQRTVARHLIMHHSHVMWVAYDGDDKPLLFCRECGAYASNCGGFSAVRWRKLSGACP